MEPNMKTWNSFVNLRNWQNGVTRTFIEGYVITFDCFFFNAQQEFINWQQRAHPSILAALPFSSQWYFVHSTCANEGFKHLPFLNMFQKTVNTHVIDKKS